MVISTFLTMAYRKKNAFTGSPTLLASSWLQMCPLLTTNWAETSLSWRSSITFWSRTHLSTRSWPASSAKPSAISSPEKPSRYQSCRTLQVADEPVRTSSSLLKTVIKLLCALYNKAPVFSSWLRFSRKRRASSVWCWNTLTPRPWWTCCFVSLAVWSRRP